MYSTIPLRNGVSVYTYSVYIICIHNLYTNPDRKYFVLTYIKLTSLTNPVSYDLVAF